MGYHHTFSDDIAINIRRREMSESQNPKKSGRKGASALFIPTGLFIGMGVGFATGNLVPGLFIGLGVGFLIFACVMIIVRE